MNLISRYNVNQEKIMKPTRIGEYSILHKIGEGAMSNVYLGIHEKTFATAAIKQLKPSLRTPKYIGMFTNEIEISSKMSHQNVTRVIGGNVEEGFIVMEYVKGVSLEHHDDLDSLLSLRLTLGIIRQVAIALKHASEQGIVHRDIKPANIILSSSGVAKLTDFGCAVPKGEIGSVVAGSLSYMSPEQLMGEPLDLHADIYSLGMVTYRLLSGNSAFKVDDINELKTAILYSAPIPLQEYRRSLPPSLIRLINKAISKDMADRQQGWDEFIFGIEDVLFKMTMNSQYELADEFRCMSQESYSQQQKYQIRHTIERDRSIYSLSCFSISTIVKH